MPSPEPAVAAALREHAEDLLTRRSLERAWTAFHHAEAVGADPDRCSAGRWETAMLLGDLESAWRENDVIRRRGSPDPHRFWLQQRIDGKRVIVRCLHGFGDAVQMLRYAPQLRERAAEVIFEVPPRFVPLARCFRGVENVITWGDDTPRPAPAWDVQVEVLELPYLFRTTPAHLPLETHYLALPPEIIASTAQRMGRRERPRVGIVWASGEWNPGRNVPLSLLESLLATPGIEFWNLQGGPAAAEADGLPLRSTQDLRDGLLPLAATIANLDLVLTADTLAAHLAGALGIPSWVMLQHAADWRWMHARDNSPWYPSLRLFRQPAPGDWASVIHRLAHELSSFAPQAHAAA
ncbi:MAG TPA: hypothetical protein VM865_05620 [Acidobacteriaceae bacterium]|nr:hypothetical protein [Acidobacteriaceae bacterium]